MSWSTPAATALAVAGTPLLPALERLDGYVPYVITLGGRHYATPGMAFAKAAARGPTAIVGRRP